MKAVLILLTVLTSAQANSFTELDILNEEWKVFKLEHGKEYKNAIEESFRFEIFKETKLFIAQHNQKFEADLESYKLGLNQYADMLQHEFNERLSDFNATLTDSDNDSQLVATFITPANLRPPSTMDWRLLGAVTDVKNQGQCSRSSWAFSATGALEGQHFRKTKQLISLSEQNLVDCTSTYGNKGCKGGLATSAFKYIIDNKGIDTEKSYQYVASKGTCKFDANNVGATISGYAVLPKNDEQKLLEAIASVGPIAISLDASQRSFQMYKSGVYNDPACSSVKLNHDMLAVGYGTERNGQQYWLVKNSWGTLWGDSGYVKIARNAGNRCGIATSAKYPLV